MKQITLKQTDMKANEINIEKSGFTFNANRYERNNKFIMRLALKREYGF